MWAFLFVAVLSSWVISPASLQDAYSADVHMYPEGEDYCPATGCFDEHPLCEEIARNGSCKGVVPEEQARLAKEKGNTVLAAFEASHYMLMCRVSCWKEFQEQREKGNLTKADILSASYGGGFGPWVFDPFGRSYSICDLSDGMTFEKRVHLLKSHIMASLSFRHNYYGVDRYTREGIKRDRIPPGLYREIIEWRRKELEGNRSALVDEDCTVGTHNCFSIEEDEYECRRVPRRNMKMLELQGAFKDRIIVALHNSAQDWASELSQSDRGERVKLAGSVVYGMRRYERGATLTAHIDQQETHVISAILNIAQDVDEPWPLEIMDWNEERHKVFLQPGDMIWYESARLPHGRMAPFNGRYFDNIFVHFRPNGVEAEKSFDVFVDAFG